MADTVLGFVVFLAVDFIAIVLAASAGRPKKSKGNHLGTPAGATAG